VRSTSRSSGPEDHQPAERVLVPDPAAGPAPCGHGGFELVAGVYDRAAIGSGEEVEIVGGPAGEVLRDQCGAAGEQEACAGRQAEEQAGDLDLEGRQALRRAVLGWTSGHHAATVVAAITT